MDPTGLPPTDRGACCKPPAEPPPDGVPAVIGGLRIEVDPDHLPATPGPPEAFDDDIAPDGLADAVTWFGTPALGPDSNAVCQVFLSRTAGYPRRPTGRELYDGMRAENPTPEQLFAIETFLWESTAEHQDQAWYEQAYSWRMLARAMRLVGWTDAVEVRELNARAARPELIPAKDKWRRG